MIGVRLVQAGTVQFHSSQGRVLPLVLDKLLLKENEKENEGLVQLTPTLSRTFLLK